MKKQLLALALLATCFVSTSLQAYEFWVLNNTDIPISVDLWLKGLRWRKGYIVLQPREYYKFDVGSDVGNCGQEIAIKDLRTGLGQPILAGDKEIPQLNFDIPTNTSCHKWQFFKINAPLANPNQTDAYYQIYGKKHGSFVVEYTGTLNWNDVADKLNGFTQTTNQQGK